MLGRSRFRSRARYLAGGAFPNASLYLNLLSGSLDSRVTFSRDSNATLVDGTGRIVYAPANLFLRSEEFNDAQWSTGGTTAVTANTTVAPSGSLTADTLTATAGAGVHLLNNAASMGVSILAGVRYALSVYVKAGTLSFFQLNGPVAFGADGFANFNVAAGTVGTVGSTATASIQDVGNGWYRCTMIATGAAASNRVNLGMITSATAVSLESWTAAGTETLFIWGAQLEPVTYQTAPGPYVATTSAAYYGPRFDYNPVTLAPLGLLIEEQRTNLLLYSAQFDDASWQKTGATVTANAVTSPDGSSNADTLVEDLSTGVHRVFNPVSCSINTTYTFTAFVKAAGRTQVRLNETILGGAFFDLSTATVISTDAGVTSSIQNAGNGWYRCRITATTGGSQTIFVAQIQASASGNSIYTGNGAAALQLYGAQLEAGSFATSYMPTVAAPFTRLADVATMTGTNFSSWYNQPAGTFVLDGDTFTVSTVDFPLTANDGSNNNRFGVYRSNLSLAGYVVTGSVTQMELTSAVAAVNTTFRVAVAATANNGNVAINGNIGAGDTSITMPTVDRLSIGSNNGAGIISGHIRQIAYFNTRLPNAQLEALTAPPLITSLSLDFLNGVYEG